MAVVEPFRVVVADDVEDLRFAYRMTLELSRRFQVVGEASTGAAALKAVEELLPDILLLDVSMPDRDGLEVLPEIRKTAPDTKIVVLSGFNAPRLAPLALSRGATKYLEKGMTPQAMVEELLDAVDAGRLEEPLPIRPHAPAAPAPVDEEIIAAVAHEVRNGLTALQGVTSLLATRLADLPSDVAVEMAQRAYRQSRFLDGVVRSMLMLPAIEAGEALLDPSVYPAAELLTDLSKELRVLAGDREFISCLDDDLPDVEVDRERFQQVLMNVVGNAYKYSPPEGRIVLTARREGPEVIVSISDSGPGIPPEFRDKVFEKYARVTAERSSIGIGLYIARALMKAMRGRIWVADATSGTTVSCAIPVA